MNCSIRNQGSFREILVFEHLDHPDAGIQVPAGTVQLGLWNKYVGDYAVPMGSRVADTEKMTMDLWGFTWDVTYTRTLCVDNWHFQLNYGLVKAPNINCGDRDVLNFLVGCGVTECDDLQALFGTQTSFSGGVGA